MLGIHPIRTSGLSFDLVSRSDSSLTCSETSPEADLSFLLLLPNRPRLQSSRRKYCELCGHSFSFTRGSSSFDSSPRPSFRKLILVLLLQSLRSCDAHSAPSAPLRLATPPTSVQTTRSRPQILPGRDHMAWNRTLAHDMGLQALLRHGERTVSACRRRKGS